MGTQNNIMLSSHQVASHPYGYGYGYAHGGLYGGNVHGLHPAASETVMQRQHQVMNMNHKSHQHLAEVNRAQCEERQAAGQRRHDDFMKARNACASDISEGRLYTSHPCDGL